MVYTGIGQTPKCYALTKVLPNSTNGLEKYDPLYRKNLSKDCFDIRHFLMVEVFEHKTLGIVETKVINDTNNCALTFCD